MKKEKTQLQTLFHLHKYYFNYHYNSKIYFVKSMLVSILQVPKFSTVKWGKYFLRYCVLTTL